MRTVTHREMRNNSGEILRAVADGETIQVTNHGRVAAVISPPENSSVADLVERGLARPARLPMSSLAEVDPQPSSWSTAKIIADIRGAY